MCICRIIKLELLKTKPVSVKLRFHYRGTRPSCSALDYKQSSAETEDSASRRKRTQIKNTGCLLLHLSTCKQLSHLSLPTRTGHAVLYHSPKTRRVSALLQELNWLVVLKITIYRVLFSFSLTLPQPESVHMRHSLIYSFTEQMLPSEELQRGTTAKL